MKLRILSDLHLDHRQGQFELEKIEHDVLVCVGDVRGSLTDGIEVLGNISRRPVVFVGGNHEFYGFDGASLEEAYERGRERAGKGSPVHLLENEALVLDRVRFLGTTLWTDYALYGEESRKQAMEVARHGLNDHRAIRLREASGASRRFLPSDALSLHHKALQWLSGVLSEPFDGPTVVCTHHGPHRRSVAAQYDGDLLSAAFVSHLPELVEGPNAPDLWIHGHTHAALDYRVGKCRVICNPLGYPHERTSVNTGLVVELLTPDEEQDREERWRQRVAESDRYLDLDPDDPTLEWRDRIKARLARQRVETGLSGLDEDGNCQSALNWDPTSARKRDPPCGAVFSAAGLARSRRRSGEPAAAISS